MVEKNIKIAIPTTTSDGLNALVTRRFGRCPFFTIISIKNGEIDTIYAAHDAGKIINPVLFEGQIEGAVHLGLGYALSEELELENGHIKSTKLKDLGLLRMNRTPKIVVKGVEVRDPIGPYGAKGVGEIGLVPTAAAVANAFSYYENKSYNKLPLKKKVKKN